MKRHRWLVFASPLAIVAACGSRTGLLAPHDVASSEGADAAEQDALPPIDVVVPPGPSPCPDAGATFVYVITTQNVLMSFYPPTAAFTIIGTIACPTDVMGDAPFSMAVDHTGVAYVAFVSGSLFEVSTLTAACQAASLNPGSGIFQSQFGMGFAGNVGADGGLPRDGGDAGDGVETLYLAGNPSGAGGPSPIVLGSLDTTTFATNTVGVVTPSIYGSELTGTGGGQLFGFYETTPGGAAAAIGQIDRATGRLLSMSNLPGVSILNGWAFAFWGGDFYTFTAPDGVDTVVQRFRPSDGSVVQVATIAGLTVVGAGVSTCAPQR